MPIQFRCGSCNQLLGIATRKAGHVVNCPTCGNKTVVPRTNGVPAKAVVPQAVLAPAAATVGPPTEGAAAEAAAPAFTAEPEEPVGLSLLDRVDMDALLAPPREGQPVATPPAVATAPESPPREAPAANPRPNRKKDLEFTAMPPAAPQEELESLPEIDALAVQQQFTLELTPMRVTVLVVLFIALLAGVLLLGMWLGSRFAAT